ncbi:MAG: hypothetical protein EP309_08065 [Gammaproteobacteria bacterium]|nr:hypothetical protein [Candidatus Thioaporhodococcus sediminis]TNF53030.1 MAG: hypothetical protein EP309_08065 [Gammaproteobacteria bacterium]
MVVQHPPRLIPLQAERGGGAVTPEAIDQDGAGSRYRALVVDQVLAGGVESRVGGGGEGLPPALGRWQPQLQYLLIEERRYAEDEPRGRRYVAAG